MVRKAAQAAAEAVKEELRAEMCQQLAEAYAATRREVESVIRRELTDIKSALAALVPGAAPSMGSRPLHTSAPPAEGQVATSQHVARVRAQPALQKQTTRKRASRELVPAQAQVPTQARQAPPPARTQVPTQAPPPARASPGGPAPVGMRIRI